MDVLHKEHILLSIDCQFRKLLLSIKSPDIEKAIKLSKILAKLREATSLKGRISISESSKIGM